MLYKPAAELPVDLELCSAYYLRESKLFIMLIKKAINGRFRCG